MLQSQIPKFSPNFLNFSFTPKGKEEKKVLTLLFVENNNLSDVKVEHEELSDLFFLAEKRNKKSSTKQFASFRYDSKWKKM